MFRLGGSLYLAAWLILLSSQFFAADGAFELRKDSPQADRIDLYRDPLPSGAVARLGTVRFRHGDQVYAVAFSPDGKTLVSAGGDQVVRCWDAATGKELRRFEGHEGGVWRVLFSADGKTLASGSEDQTMRLWDVATGRERHRFRDRPQIVGRNFALSPDGKTLTAVGSVTGSDDWFLERLVFWDVASGKELPHLKTGAFEFGSARLVYSPDGKTLALLEFSDTIRLLDAATGKTLREFIGHREIVESDRRVSAVESVMFSPDGLMLASGATDQTVRLWRVATGEQVRCLEGHEGPVRTVAFSPDGKTVASGSKDQTIRLWEVRTGREVYRFRGDYGAVHCICFSPNGRWLAAACDDQTVHLWEVATRKEVQPYTGHQRAISSIAYSPDSKSLATAGPDLTVYRWEADSGKGRCHVVGSQTDVHCTALSADGESLAAGDKDGMIYLRNLRMITGADREFVGHQGAVQCVAFAADGKTLASAGYEGTIELWDVASGKNLREVNLGQENYTQCLCFSPDGKMLASTAGGNRVVLWGISTGKEVRRMFVGDRDRTTCFAFSPDGRTLAAGIYDGSIYLWEVGSGKERLHVQGQQSDLRAIAFSPDGKTLAFAGRDRIVHVWDLASASRVRRFEGHQGVISSLVFSPNGKTLASASHDTTALIWDVSDLTVPGTSRAAILAASELETLWADMADADACKAYRALCTLVRSPQQAAPFLHQRLQPAPDIKAERIRQLISVLDSEQFKARAEAERQLQELAELAAQELRTALASKLSGEIRRRAEKLLQNLDNPVVLPDLLRALRAVEVLERIGTPEARTVLKSLAQGAPAARQTREVQRALDRLDRLQKRD